MAIDDVKIGDFSKPVTPPKKAPASAAQAAQPSPADARLEAQEAALDKEAEQAEKTLSPLQAYEKRLKEIGVTREQAAEMVDTLLTQGYWSEEVPVTQRLKVRLRTRKYRDTERLRNYIEVIQPKFPDYYNDILFKYSLAASIERFGKQVFSHPGKNESKEVVENAFQERLAFVDDMEEPMLRVLYGKLQKFDDKVRVVFEEGAIENF